MWALLGILFIAALVFPPLGMVLVMLVAWAAEYWWVFVPGGIFWFAIMSGGCHHRDY
jgi:hypothetical protein